MQPQTHAIHPSPLLLSLISSSGGHPQNGQRAEQPDHEQKQTDRLRRFHRETLACDFSAANSRGTQHQQVSDVNDQRPNSKRQWIRSQFAKLMTVLGDCSTMGSAYNTLDQFQGQKQRDRDGRWPS